MLSLLQALAWIEAAPRCPAYNGTDYSGDLTVAMCLASITNGKSIEETNN